MPNKQSPFLFLSKALGEDLCPRTQWRLKWAGDSGPGSVRVRLDAQVADSGASGRGDWPLTPFGPLPRSLSEKGHSGVSRQTCPLGHHKQRVKSPNHSSYPTSSRKRLSLLSPRVLPLLSPSPRNCRGRAEKVAFSVDQSRVSWLEAVSSLCLFFPPMGRLGKMESYPWSQGLPQESTCQHSTSWGGYTLLLGGCGGKMGFRSCPGSESESDLQQGGDITHCLRVHSAIWRGWRQGGGRALPTPRAPPPPQTPPPFPGRDISPAGKALSRGRGHSPTCSSPALGTPFAGHLLIPASGAVAVSGPGMVWCGGSRAIWWRN